MEPKPKINVLLSNEEDHALLKFLWKWKVSTTAAIAEVVYTDRALCQTYVRLKKLEKAGYIQAKRLSNDVSIVWTLAKRGYLKFRELLPKLRAEGFRSEAMEHDLLVAAAHGGDWILEGKEHVRFFTEQQLRCYDFSVYPPGIPNNELHRTDGYWQIPTLNGLRTIALEVELSQKPDHAYEHIARFFRTNPQISKVIWITKWSSMTRKIHKLMVDANRADTRHAFVELEPFLTQGWNTQIEIGQDAGKTIRETLCDSARNAMSSRIGTTFFDTRKTPHKSKHSAPDLLRLFRS